MTPVFAGKRREEDMSKERVWSKPRALMLGLALALGSHGFGRGSRESKTIWWKPTSIFETGRSQPGTSKIGFAPVVKSVVPAVVNISSSKVVRTPNQFSGGQMDPFFRQFFGEEGEGRFNIPRERREQSLGSGVIISPEGYILTNNHVVDGATNVKVMLSDKREFKAAVVGTDPKTDIAVLKIDGSSFPSVTIGDSSKVQVGDYALAIGDPFGVGQTVTMGIVSATAEPISVSKTMKTSSRPTLRSILETQAGHWSMIAVSWLEFNTAILSHGSGGNQGIGFAVPVNLARNVMDQILAHGKVTRAYMGIVPQDVTPALAKQFGSNETKGALVGDVSADSPAAKAGLKRW
jgi:serine protease Do